MDILLSLEKVKDREIKSQLLRDLESLNDRRYSYSDLLDSIHKKYLYFPDNSIERDVSKNLNKINTKLNTLKEIWISSYDDKIRDKKKELLEKKKIYLKIEKEFIWKVKENQISTKSTNWIRRRFWIT